MLIFLPLESSIKWNMISSSPAKFDLVCGGIFILRVRGRSQTNISVKPVSSMSLYVTSFTLVFTWTERRVPPKLPFVFSTLRGIEFRWTDFDITMAVRGLNTSLLSFLTSYIMLVPKPLEFLKQIKASLASFYPLSDSATLSRNVTRLINMKILGRIA